VSYAALYLLAYEMRRAHDPAQQGDDAWPGRCAQCSYCRHPCVTFELADGVLSLLDELDRGDAVTDSTP
jgi:hypothetical protein